MSQAAQAADIRNIFHQLQAGNSYQEEPNTNQRELLAFCIGEYLRVIAPEQVHFSVIQDMFNKVFDTTGFKNDVMFFSDQWGTHMALSNEIGFRLYLKKAPSGKISMEEILRHLQEVPIKVHFVQNPKGGFADEGDHEGNLEAILKEIYKPNPGEEMVDAKPVLAVRPNEKGVVWTS